MSGKGRGPRCDVLIVTRGNARRCRLLRERCEIHKGERHAPLLIEASERLHAARKQVLEVRKQVVRLRYRCAPLPLDRYPLNGMKRVVAECLQLDPYSIRQVPHR